MNIYISASNEYVHIIEQYAVLFNKYWPNQNVTVLCYDVPNIPIPDNFKFVSLGKQGKYWSNGLIDFFNNIKDEYFVFSLEDFFLVDYVDQYKVDLLEQEIVKGADKASLHFYYVYQIKNPSDRIVVLKQNIKYKTSIHPAIWTRRYMLQNLKPDMSLIDFENNPLTDNDGSKIVFLKECMSPQKVVSVMNIYARGELDLSNFVFYSMKVDGAPVYIEDKDILMDVINNNTHGFSKGTFTMPQPMQISLTTIKDK